jgi:hypothetical protein
MLSGLGTLVRRLGSSRSEVLCMSSRARRAFIRALAPVAAGVSGKTNNRHNIPWKTFAKIANKKYGSFWAYGLSHLASS